MEPVNGVLAGPAHVVVDGGQTACRVAVVQGGRIREVGQAAGFSYHGDGDATTAIVDAVCAGLAVLTAPPSIVDTACLGLTGAPAVPQERERLARAVRDRLDAQRVLVTGDAVTAYVGALGSGAGAVVVAGTGAVALAIGENGRTAQVDGWGYMLGDAGGGYWVGRRGLEDALRAFDGRRSPCGLLDAALRRFGRPESLANRLSLRAVAQIASFAEDVAQAARAGDADALGIFQAAARHLADTAAAAIGRVLADVDAPVSWAGQLFQAGDLLLEPFRRQLTERCPNVTLVEPRGSGLDGAQRLAETDRLGPLATLITEARS